MKKFICIICILSMCLGLCACGSRDSRTGVDNGGDFTSSVTVTTPTPVDTPAPLVTAPPSAEPTAQIVPTSAPAAGSMPTSNIYVVNPAVSITKNPTAETVNAGGSATFIAKADYWQSLVWITVSPDVKTVYTLAEAPNHFSGLSVTGQGSETLKLSNIPLEMNGWGIQCYFVDSAGERYYTTRAKLTVNEVTSGDEQKAKDLATECWKTVKKYADYNGFALGEITWLGFSDGKGEFHIPMTRGEVELHSTFASYPASSDYYPESMQWYQNGTKMETCFYDKSTDPEVWNTYEKDILDVSAFYGWL